MKIEIDETNKVIKVPIPLTSQSGKIRVKVRNDFTEYGLPTPTRQIPFSLKHYVEWQIGYDVDKSNLEKLALSTLPYTEFKGANNKPKAFYELSEYLYYFVQWGLITKVEIGDLLTTLENIRQKDFLDSNFNITRDRTQPKEVLEMVFYHLEVKYPLLVYSFDSLDISVEIAVREKQRAVDIQPMLYVCFPLEKLQPAPGMPFLLKRTAQPKEHAYLLLADQDKYFLLETMKIFGILSANHKHDVLEILKAILCIKKN
ncbi:R.Pab1 family restriction endonuclease [Helicobacter suis]|uniref:R.Pab1 family restriction endonuclease n=1 Tax=Helicobacter suis TaxID=104628 RepID=UPI002492387B|nr:R.Pab1 family restriction endonuclease [Helicobacter suis]